MSRRTWTASWALLLLSACVWSGPAQPVAAPEDPAPTEQIAEPTGIPVPELPAEHGLRTLERWVGGASPGDDVPVIVAVHGLGDNPDHFAWLVEGYPQPARVVLPAGPTPFGDGFAWMTIRTRDGRPDELAAQVDAAAARVAALCRDLGRDGKKPVLMGFSQGGIVSWTVAVRHPDTIAAAVPISGYLPELLAKPPEGRTPAPIHAVHGDADQVVPLDLARQGQAALASGGFEADLQVFPGVAHVIPPAVQRTVHARVSAAAGP